MSDILHIFGSQFDAAVVQALMRHEKQRRTSDRERDHAQENGRARPSGPGKRRREGVDKPATAGKPE